MISFNTPRVIFWDFDGVIKDSIEIKTCAFMQLFQPYGAEVAKQVRAHHEAHGGMPRFEKIPIYLKWVGEAVTPERIQEYCQRFGQLARQGVIDAPWVPGAEALLRKNSHEQVFILVSATPQEEIEDILVTLNLRSCFAAVYGAPKSKRDAIRETLIDRGFAPSQCLMIGDAQVDWDAAKFNQVPFLLRRHATNGRVFQHFTEDFVEDFTAL